jgi:hypothetical protein
MGILGVGVLDMVCVVCGYVCWCVGSVFGVGVLVCGCAGVWCDGVGVLVCWWSGGWWCGWMCAVGVWVGVGGS